MNDSSENPSLILPVELTHPEQIRHAVLRLIENLEAGSPSLEQLQQLTSIDTNQPKT
jgi:hypothetical protein